MIRMSGMISGLDTDSIVKGLMASKRAKQDKIKGKKQKLEWTQDIWKGLNTKLYGFYKDYAGKMRFQSSYGTKSATSTDTSKVTVNCTSSAVNGSYDVTVNSLASAQYVTSGKMDTVNGEKVTKNTKLSDLGITEGTQIKATAGDKTVALNVDADTTVQNFIDSMKSAGINASFDENQQRFFLSSKESGSKNAFTLTAGTISDTQRGNMTNVLNAVGTDLSSAQKSSVNAELAKLQYATDQDKAKADAKKNLLAMSDDVVKSKVSAHLSENKKNELGYLDADGNVTEAGKQALLDSGVTQEDYDLWTDDDKKKSVSAYLDKEVSKYMNSDDAKRIIDTAVTDGYTDGDVSVAKQSEREDAIGSAVDTFATGTADSVTTSDVLSKLKLGNVDGSAIAESSSDTGMSVVAAADSVIVLNGATLTSDSTSLTVNGMTLDLHGVTNGSSVKLTVNNDTQAVYDSIKDFLTQYNSLLSELTTKYNADSAKDYDVLTDDEKEAMSDSEVEKWNDKIKGSLLRRDSTVGNLMSTMREAMTISCKASNGKSYSLASLGISTSTDWTEGGLLHIKGDEDDSVYATEDNKLMNMLTEDPQTVCEVLSSITTNLYNQLGNKMATTSMSSALTFYNDKEMSKQLKEYKEEISDWDTKLSTMEDRYYCQFSSMESALAKLQSQQSSLSGMLG